MATSGIGTVAVECLLLLAKVRERNEGGGGGNRHTKHSQSVENERMDKKCMNDDFVLAVTLTQKRAGGLLIFTWSTKCRPTDRLVQCLPQKTTSAMLS